MFSVNFIHYCSNKQIKMGERFASPFYHYSVITLFSLPDAKNSTHNLVCLKCVFVVDK